MLGSVLQHCCNLMICIRFIQTANENKPEERPPIRSTRKRSPELGQYKMAEGTAFDLDLGDDLFQDEHVKRPKGMAGMLKMNNEHDYSVLSNSLIGIRSYKCISYSPFVEVDGVLKWLV